MSDEQDSFMMNAFGVDLGRLAQNIKDEASAAIGQAASTVTQVVQGVQGAVEGAIGGVTGAVTGAAKKVAGVVSGSPSAGASGGGTGSFPLGGSVGRGGKNAPNDVRAVQAALGISADGQCGRQTIAAIEAFQRNLGQAKPDGRVDAGGGTERALAGGMKPAPAPTPPLATLDDDSGSFFDQAVKGVQDLGGRIVKEAEEDFDAAKEFVGEAFEVAKKSLGDPNIALNQVRPGDAGAKEAGAPDAGPRDGGASDAGDAGAEEAPIFNATSPVPHDVRADTLEAFVGGANAGRGPIGSAGHLQASFKFSPDPDSRGRIAKVNMVCDTSIVRPRFAGGRPTDDQRALIKQAEELIKGHEERHRDIARDFANRMVKAMRGKSGKEANENFTKLISDMNGAQRNLDLREGQLIVEFNGPNGKSGPSTAVRLGPAPPN